MVFTQVQAYEHAITQSPQIYKKSWSPAGCGNMDALEDALPKPLPWPPTLVDALRHRAVVAGDKIAYLFTEYEVSTPVETTISWGALDLSARRIAAELQLRGLAGEPVLHVFRPGLDFIAGYFGCLYAGAIAVPTFPPFNASTAARFTAVIGQLAPRAVLTSASLRTALGPLLDGRVVVAVDEIAAGLEDRWAPPDLGAESVAMLQYTSGSTSQPKGVILTHANLLHNIAQCRDATFLSERSIGVYWLPPHHDMGLIGGILPSVCLGYPAVHMSPLAMLKKPLRWLQAITKHRGTTTAAPNFAYELVAARVTPEELGALDLSSLVTALNGAEPIRASTVERFVEVFGPRGFRRDAMVQAFGLAEATLAVTTARGTPHKSFDREGLEVGLARAPRPGLPSRTLVSCGRVPVSDQRICVVDPQTRARQPDGRVGEIWVQGPSVAKGYWGMKDASASVFGAELADGSPGTFMRTGDLGFIDHGDLYVAGRSKDVIIVRGRKCYPQDIEDAASAAHGAVRAGYIAAFAVEDAHGEGIAVAVEVDQRRMSDPQEVVAAVRRSITETIDVAPAKIVLVPPGSVQKTTSGKTMRDACRRGIGSGEIVPLYAWARTEPAAAGPSSRRSGEIEAWLVETVARLASLAPTDVDLDQSPATNGVDSLGAAELATLASERTRSRLPATAFVDGRSLRALAAILAAAPPAEAAPEEAPQVTTRLPRPRRGCSLPAFSLAARTLYGLRADGVDRLPEGPVIFCPNHESHLDIFLVAGALPAALAQDLVCVGKREHWEAAPARLMATLARAIPVDRDGDVRETLAACGEVLRARRSLLIHPEGTRTADGRLGPFKPGAALLAIRHQVPLVPVRIRGAYDILPKSRRFPSLFDWRRVRRWPLEVRFGPALVPPRRAVASSEAARALTAELRRAVESL
jgi:1-acyl-sn-glycerol-3-phosphate acyltransferase